MRERMTDADADADGGLKSMERAEGRPLLRLAPTDETDVLGCMSRFRYQRSVL